MQPEEILPYLNLIQELLTLNNLGIAYLTQAQLGKEPTANLEKAIAAYAEAITILRQPGLERNLALTLNNLGNAYRTQAQLGKEPTANLEKAIASHKEAAQICHQLGLERDLVEIRINLGSDYQEKEDLDGAITCYEKSLEFLTESSNYKTFGMVLNKLGKVLFVQRNYSRAIQILEQAHELWEKKKELPELAITLYELAKLYHRTGCLERARLYFKDSLRLFRRLQEPNKILPVLTALGNLELQCGKLEPGVEHLKEAQEYLQDHPNPEKLTEVEYLLSLVSPTYTQDIQYVNP